MNRQRFHQQKRIEMKTEQCERSLSERACCKVIALGIDSEDYDLALVTKEAKN